MTRNQIIQITADDIHKATLRLDDVGKPDFFGEPIEQRDVELSIRGHMKRLSDLLALTDGEWNRRWEESGKREDEIEMDAALFAAGRG